MLDRRGFLVVSAAVGTTAAVSTTAGAVRATSTVGRFDRPNTGWAPRTTVLRTKSASSVGLDLSRLKQARAIADEGAFPASGAPLYPGASTLLAHHGGIVDHYATGWSLRFADRAGTELPESQRIAMRTDTIFDIASISKLFTALVALKLMEQGKFGLDEPVAHHVPGYEANGKDTITPRMLFTHTAGLLPDPIPSLWQGYPDVASRKKAIRDTTPKAEPGSAYEYSDLSMLSMQLLVEAVSGSTLDDLVRRIITTPLRMTDTGYNPPANKKHRIAPTEYETGEGTSERGLVWGQVHDENAWSLDGVAGHAGIFSTTGDLAVLGQMLLNGGTYAGRRILREETTALVFTDFNQQFPGQNHGLGLELDQIWYMGGLSAADTAGHTGFTGTSLVLDKQSQSIAIVLTNRVHPNRDTNVNGTRERIATALSRAMAVLPLHGKDYFNCEIGNDTSATLSLAALDTRRGPAELTFAAFVNSEESDHLCVQTSTDGSRWTTASLRVDGTTTDHLSGGAKRRWQQVHVRLPLDEHCLIRLLVRTDKSYTGRGFCVDTMRVTAAGRTVFDADRNPGAVRLDGWQRRQR